MRFRLTFEEMLYDSFKKTEMYACGLEISDSHGALSQPAGSRAVTPHICLASDSGRTAHKQAQIWPFSAHNLMDRAFLECVFAVSSYDFDRVRLEYFGLHTSLMIFSLCG